MLNEISLFGREKRTNELKKTTLHQRSIIKELLYSDLPLSIYQLNNKTKIVTSVIRDIIETFVKVGYVTFKEIRKHPKRRDYGYKLTKYGLIPALAVLIDEKLVIGHKKKDYLLEIFQPDKGADPINVFVCNVMINAINRNNLQEYVLNFIRNSYEYAETVNEVNVWKFAEGIVEASVLEIQPIRECISKALETLSDSEREIVVQFYKSNITSVLFNFGMQSHNLYIQKIATMSSKDAEGLYLPVTCKCGYSNDQAHFKMEDIILKAFIGGLECPKCLRVIKTNKIDHNQMRMAKMKLYPR